METTYEYIIIDDEPKAIKLLNDAISHNYPYLHMAGSYTTWKPALDALKMNVADLVFIDITMPRVSGMGLLEMAPDITGEIIFVTAHEDYALNAYEFSPSGYILKPINEALFRKAVDTALKRVYDKKKKAGGATAPAATSQPRKIGVRNKNGLDYINIDDVLFLEACTRYTKIFTRDKTYVSTNNLGKFKDMLEDNGFFPVHRSYMVNIGRVASYKTIGIVIMENGTEIPISRSAREGFLQLFSRI